MEKFCTDEEFLEVVVNGNKEVFDIILSRVFQKGVETALLYIPEMVDKTGKRLAATTKIFNDFLEKHPEFKNYKDLVIRKIQQMELKNPTKPFEEILEKAAVEIEEEIKLLSSLKEKL